MLDKAFHRIAKGFSGHVGGPFHIARVLSPGSPTVDAGGSITSAGSATETKCKAQVDVVTEAMRSAEDFQQRDVRIILIDLTAAPTENERLVIDAGPNAGVYTVRDVVRDPLGVGFECRGRAVKGATA